MLKAMLRIEDPEAIECTVTLTMPLRDWMKLREQLQDKWPSWQLGGAISRLAAQVNVRLTENVDVSP